jgi:heme A synthase
MTSVHAVAGLATAALIAVVVVWALVAKIAHRTPGPSFERAARGAAGLLGLQAIFGVVLLAIGHHRSALHYVYGIAALVVMLGGVLLARALERDRWVVLAWSAFIAGLLVMRALMTGYHKV